MTVNVKVAFDAKRVISRLTLLPKKTRVIRRQILNRQRKQSKTRIVRALSKWLNVRPQKRIRRRVLLPQSGQARNDMPVAIGLVLMEYLPTRWFVRSKRDRRPVLPGGARLFEKRSQGGALVDRYVDASRVAYRIRELVLVELAGEFPREFARRMRVEIGRLF